MRKIGTLIIIILLIIIMYQKFGGFFNNITKEEAEQIALEDAKSKGFETVSLWKKFDYETNQKYTYSQKYDKDVNTWKVQLDIKNHPDEYNSPALIYFISVNNGEIIATINIVDNVEEDIENTIEN